MKIGDIVYPKGCSKQYQLENPLTIKHLEERHFACLCDGDLVDSTYQVASENGWSWYPLNTLEMPE